MHAKEKVKMCPFCEGSIPLEATECRYCGSALRKGAKTPHAAYQTEDSLSSMYDPPYTPKKPGPSPAGVFHASDINEEEEEASLRPPSRQPKAKRPPPAEPTAEEATKLGALLLLSIGSTLFTLAWLLFFFSDHGRVTLEWKSRYWPLYLLLSVPLLYQGWKKLNT